MCLPPQGLFALVRKRLLKAPPFETFAGSSRSMSSLGAVVKAESFVRFEWVAAVDIREGRNLEVMMEDSTPYLCVSGLMWSSN